jgi:hypothetical protein
VKVGDDIFALTFETATNDGVQTMPHTLYSKVIRVNKALLHVLLVSTNDGPGFEFRSNSANCLKVLRDYRPPEVHAIAKIKKQPEGIASG